LTNTVSESFYDIAAALSVAIGKDVSYQSPPTDEFQSTLRQFGVPDLYIGMLSMWASAVVQGAMDVKDDTLTQFLGRTPTTVKQFMIQTYTA